jgi:hypothetical protein
MYRFEGATDGALFALAQGTDPEAFLLLRVQASRWEFAVARFTDLRLRVLLQGREVFSGPRTTGAPGEVYESATVLQKPSDNPADFE